MGRERRMWMKVFSYSICRFLGPGRALGMTPGGFYPFPFTAGSAWAAWASSSE
jgi:hypothetical protein